MSDSIKWSLLSPEDRDRLVAEKIMGWQPVQCDEDVELTVYDDGDAWCPRCHAREHINSFDHDIIPPPAYTRSLDAAWQIAELERFSHVELMRYSIGDVIDPAYKYDCRLITNGEAFHSFGYTPQEAICLAALRAAGLGIE